MPADEDVFDEPSHWRLAAVRSLGLVGDERIAGIVTGAAYPDALAPIVEALTSVTGLVVDVGGGSGGASHWIAARAGARVLVVEPVTASAPCYHQACDTFANVALDVLGDNADAVATATLKWAKSTRDLGVGDANRVAARQLAAVEQVNHNLPADLAAS